MVSPVASTNPNRNIHVVSVSCHDVAHSEWLTMILTVQCKLRAQANAAAR